MTQKPAILIVVENLPVPLDRRVWQEACALRDAGYEVIVICPQMRGFTTPEETLDGIRNHSWSRPAPATPEGEVVSWADRIAYVCHDFEDAVAAGIVTPDMLPPLVRQRCGVTRSRQLGAFVHAMIDASTQTGRIGMLNDSAVALGEFRQFNYERVYLRPASKLQAGAVISLLQALVELYAHQPNLLAGIDASPSAEFVGALRADSPEAMHTAVRYVSGMTDRFACRQAMTLLGWGPERLPQGVGMLE